MSSFFLKKEMLVSLTSDIIKLICSKSLFYICSETDKTLFLV